MKRTPSLLLPVTNTGSADCAKRLQIVEYPMENPNFSVNYKENSFENRHKWQSRQFNLLHQYYDIFVRSRQQKSQLDYFIRFLMNACYNIHYTGCLLNIRHKFKVWFLRYFYEKKFCRKIVPKGNTCHFKKGTLRRFFLIIFKPVHAEFIKFGILHKLLRLNQNLSLELQIINQKPTILEGLRVK